MALGSISRWTDTRGNVRWRVRFEVRDEGGRRLRRQVSVPTRRAAERLLQHLLAAHAGQSPPSTALGSTAESVDRWLRDRSTER